MNTYKVAGISTTDKWTERNNNTGLGQGRYGQDLRRLQERQLRNVVRGLDANAAESTPAFEWHLTADQIGKIIDLDGKPFSAARRRIVCSAMINLVRKDGNVDGGLTITFGVTSPSS